MDWVLWSEFERRADAVLPARERPYEIACDEWGELFDLLETAQRDGSKEAARWLAVMRAVRQQQDAPPVWIVSRPANPAMPAKYFKSEHGEGAWSIGRGCLGLSIRTRGGWVHWHGELSDAPALVQQCAVTVCRKEFTAPTSHIESESCAAIRIVS